MQRKTLMSGLAAVSLIFAACNASAFDNARAGAAAKTFYTGWTDPSDTQPVSARYGTNASVTAGLRSSLSAMASDDLRVSSVLCGRNVPSSVDIGSNVAVSGDTATVTLNRHFGAATSATMPVTVRLVRSGNSWLVDSVDCPNSGHGGDSSSMMSSDSSMDSSDSSMTSSRSSSSSSRPSSTSSSSSRSGTSSSSSSSRTSSSAGSTSSMTSTTSSSSSSTSHAGRGQFCGGIGGIRCATGLTCQYDGSYPDAGGTCI